ncbi:hypothetical protein AWJ09_04370 [Vibrio cholerae]|uniref:hypothetical protein n=1 Tax=Vibrio cholerae TaxID=666 RepID=UPI0007C52A81|nr:hypothetical protein [Vibrio cholerae]KAA1217102.1 hypothetical protein F0Q05_06860 [Vibrio cholerae]KAA1219468.1 hypothetical protein F0P99_08755 [Vibrio cholerae]MTB75140.1 hypothetical protein [Vibrio cholerae O1 biovar El Tor]OAE83140.1 hypothetical protein AWJ09_04370 [Vibrio cholerae]TYW51277.1 hypothetical protein FY559_16350 [Vibrio cholerae]
MKVVPMIFNTDMVKALMAGDKVVTRRPVKIDYERGMKGPVVRGRNGEVSVLSFAPIAGLCPFGNFGDLIYVRETFGCCGVRSVYKADDDGASCMVKKWTPSIHMPRTESRLTLKVTDVRIERVQDITEEQCWKEGVEHIDGQFDIHQLSEMAKTFDGTFEDAKALFACLWDSIYQNWNQNPYVWVIEFEVIHQNVDKYLESVKESA